MMRHISRAREETHHAFLHSYPFHRTRTLARQVNHGLPFGSRHHRRCRFPVPLPPLEDPQFLSQPIPMRQQEERVRRGGIGPRTI